MNEKIAGVNLEIKQGDIANQSDMTAIVNAANAQLKTGGGVAGAIHRQAGPELEKACRPLAPIEPGEAVITKGYNLPNDYVVHCLGPVYGRDKPEDKLLANCYKNALELAEENNIASIAFPAISTGAFGYPLREATKIAVKSVVNKAQDLKNIDKVRFVIYTDNDLQVYQEIIKNI
ncbi:macro domain-containing protein [Halanaerobacter jeridensis]|uniref:O-acetyl-ADP-ribose deacetylase (Regulator of RNase III) n=1 Tax=Halanaerobacter jeridensis TaxID=706427 RepID=A0A938XTS0_9FIRM|nr:macro domain-containing protein [Halanaerobacter jeridensis]MBM7556744.1 O-acetyl-ADP-ribose deacetylase (regulator of RNase III) [Halanaerobacter jeridensis]